MGKTRREVGEGRKGVRRGERMGEEKAGGWGRVKGEEGKG